MTANYWVDYVPAGQAPIQENYRREYADTLRGARVLERLLRVCGHTVALISERPLGGNVQVMR